MRRGKLRRVWEVLSTTQGEKCEMCEGGHEEKAPCPTSAEDLKKMFPNAPDAVMERLAELLNKHGEQFGIDTKEKLQHFLAQAGHESGGFNRIGVTENMNYSAQGLLSTFPRWFSLTDTNKANPNDYARQPEKIGNYVYGRENLGNGVPTSGDGYKYRGRGIFQLTGKSNYQSFQSYYNREFEEKIDLIANPTLVATNDELAVISALWYYQTKVLNRISVSENTSADMVTFKINGGTNGKEDRRKRTEVAKKSIDCNE